MHRWHLSATDKCATCDSNMIAAGELHTEERPIEDENHVWLHCPKYNNARQQLVLTAADEGIRWPLTVGNILGGDSELNPVEQ